MFEPTLPTLDFSIQGIQVNPSLWGHDFQFLEDVQAAGNTTVMISNSVQLVAVNAESPEPSNLWLAVLSAEALLARAKVER
jgi:hypothetical protein